MSTMRIALVGNSGRPVNPEFVLNRPRYQGAQILLTRAMAVDSDVRRAAELAKAVEVEDRCPERVHQRGCRAGAHQMPDPLVKSGSSGLERELWASPGRAEADVKPVGTVLVAYCEEGVGGLEA